MRIIELGADPTRVTVVGNSKFDTDIPQLSESEQAAMRQLLGLNPTDPVLLAGCTHPGEEEIVLSAFRQVKDNVPSARLIIAPRDINRAQRVEELASAQQFTSICRTTITPNSPTADDVIILDTIGELSRVYAICSSAFVGGSLSSNGGHNVLEPLGMGKPALFGPDMSNFRDIAALTSEVGVGFQIANAEELAACWLRLLNDPALCQTIANRSRDIFHQYTGASARCAEEALRLVSSDK